MIIKEAVHGCDCCRNEFLETNPLRLTVFYNDKSLFKDAINKGDCLDHYEFCSWRCVLKFLPTIETDSYIDLPHLEFDDDIDHVNELKEICKHIINT